MRSLGLVVVAAGLILAGCKGDKAAQGVSGAEQAAPAAGGGASDGDFAGFDPKAEIEALQGTWKVKDSAFAKDPSTWKVAGEQVTITKGDEIKKGKLEVVYPGELAVVQESGGGTSRSYYAYARSGGDVYIGLGTAGVKRGDAYLVGDDGVVVLKAKACKYFKKKMFGGFEDPTAVKCEVKQEGDKQVFSYQVPDKFKKGELTQKTVDVVGEALLNQQMQGHKAVKAN